MKPEREKKKWWYADTEENKAYKVEGFSITGFPEHWWVPELGITAIVHYHLFPTKKAAWASVRSYVVQKMGILKVQLEQAEATLKEIDRGEE